MSTITLSLADEDLAFLKKYAGEQGITAEDFLAQQARKLREQLQKPIHPTVLAATGILQAEVTALEFVKHQENKHR